MSKIPKHEPARRKTKPQPPQSEPPATVVLTGPDGFLSTAGSMQHDINHVAGLADIQDSLDWIAKGIGRLTSDEFTLSLGHTNHTNPVHITLAPNDDGDDTLERLVTAFERVADSVAKLAGLSRPRLEPWHDAPGHKAA